MVQDALEELGNGREEEEGDERSALRLLIGGRGLRGRRLRRLALTQFIRNQDDDEEGDEDEGDDERSLLKLLVGGRGMRRRRIRKLALAHLIRNRDDDEDEDDDEEGDEEHRLLKALL